MSTSTAANRAARGSARDLLRSATGIVHQRLDDAMSARDWTDAAHYSTFLLVQADVLPAVEDALVRVGFDRALPGWSPTRRGASLHEDLAGLDVARPVPDPWPLPLDDGTAWGVAYVLEGSRLGGKLLLRRAQASPSPAVRRNTRFLGHSEAVRWPIFLASMEAALPGDAERKRAVRGAHGVFDAYMAAVERRACDAPAAAMASYGEAMSSFGGVEAA